MKKHLAILLSALLLFTSGMTAAAFEPETVESAAEVTEAIPENQAKALADETKIDIPLIDLEKGKLVFYQNFDSENAAPATVDYVDETYLTISKIYPTGATLTVETDPADETNKVLKLTNAGNSWHQYAVGMNFPLKEGKYYAAYRHAGEGDKLNGYMQRWFTTPNPVNSTGVAKDDLISVNLDCGGLNSNPKTWYNTTLTGVCKTVDGILKFGKNEDTLFPMSGTTPMQNIREFRIIPNGGNLYVDNLRIYFYPANAFTISDGTTVQMVEQTADDPIFTFPEVPGVYFYVDKNDFSRTYLPNAKVECSKLLGGAFIPVDVPLIADGKGELVLYTNFENSDKNVLTYTNPAYTNIKAFKAYRSDGSESITIVTDPTDETGKNHALRVYSSNAATHRLAVPEFDDIAILNSAYTVDSEYMLVEPSNFNQIYFRFTNKDGGDHTSSRTAAASVYLSDNAANNGIRFRASVKADTVNYENLREYGFIVARKEMLDKYLTTLTHNFYLTDDKFDADSDKGKKPLYVEGIAFEKDEAGNVIKDIAYDVAANGDVTITARLVGLDITKKEQVMADLTARPYLRYVNGSGKNVTLYGSTHTTSLYSVVKAIKDKAEAGDEAALADYEAHKTYIDSIVAFGE